MTIRREKRLSRRGAERALNRTGTSGTPSVDKVLAAAAAPPTNFELNREAETVALFRSAQLAPVAAVERLTMLQSFRAKLGAAKVLVAAGTVVALAGGGVAYAASTGNLPGQKQNDHRSPNGTSHSSQAPGQNKTTTGRPTTKPSPGKPTKTVTTPSTPKASSTPKPSLKGLCKAYQAGVADNPGKALDNPAFTALITAAGGKEKVGAFCVDLIGTPPVRPTQKPKPTQAASPSQKAKPTQAASPTKKPKPTQASTPNN